jgi:hypothetical protein
MTDPPGLTDTGPQQTSQPEDTDVRPRDQEAQRPTGDSLLTLHVSSEWEPIVKTLQIVGRVSLLAAAGTAALAQEAPPGRR